MASSSSLSRKQEILQKAAHLFNARGYSAVTMRDLADALDIKASSLYNHIKGKQEILQLLILPLAEEFTGGILAITESDKPVRIQLEEAIQQHIKLSKDHGIHLSTLYNDWMHLEGEGYDRYIDYRNAYDEAFNSLIDRAIIEKEIKAADREIIVFNLLSTLRSIHRWMLRRGPTAIARLETSLPDMLLNGIQA